MSDENTALLTPGAAAAKLGVSGAALRRMAKAYTALYGELPEAAGGGRLWTVEAISRLEQARALLAAGRAKSIRDALEAHDAGAQVSVEASTALGRDSQVLEAIAARLEGVERLEREVAELRREVAELRQLPASQRPGEVAASNEAARLTGGVLTRAMRWIEQLMRRQ